MDNYGYIDNVFNDKDYSNFKFLTNLHPYETGYHKDYQKRINGIHPIGWEYSMDINQPGIPGTYYDSKCTPQVDMRHTISSFFSPKSDMFPIHNFFLQKILNEHFPQFKDWIVGRIKLNLQLKDTTFPDDSYGVPHIDHHFVAPDGSLSNETHLSITYFLSDSDGDHCVFDASDLFYEDQTKPLDMLERIKYKKNRLVWNTGLYHSNVHVKEHDFRCVVNYVLFPGDRWFNNEEKTIIEGNNLKK